MNRASINQPFSNSVVTEVPDRSTSDNYSYIPTNYSETASSKHQTDISIASSESNQQFDRIDLIENPHPPSNPAQSAREQKSSTNVSASRRNLIKWLGFGGVGVVSAGVLHSVFSNSSSSKSPEPIASKSPAPSPVSNQSLPTANVLSQPKTSPKLTKIQFTSVKLDNKGEIIDKPAGSAEIFTEDLGHGGQTIFINGVNNAVELTMVKIPAGKFLMGSPANEKNRHSTESPQHQVNVPEFYLGQTSVTQSQWVLIMGNNPSIKKGNDKLPVENVSWLDAMYFCKKLSQKTGRIYRLPSEAEWEYACRAGTTTPFAFGETITTEFVNYNGNNSYGEAAKGYKRDKTTPVGSFPPNLFGLYDMHGNVREWCLDRMKIDDNGINTSPREYDISSWQDNKDRMYRGGCWFEGAYDCRSAKRGWDGTRGVNSFGIGFRVVSMPSTTS